MRFSIGAWAFVGLVWACIAATGCGSSGLDSEPTPVTKVVYQPFGETYRGVSIGRVSQHFDNHATETDFSFEYFLRVDVVPGSEVFDAILVLDSVSLFEGATAGVSEAQVASARGTVFRAKVGRTGRLTDFVTEGSSGSFTQELADRLLKPFLPIIPVQGGEAGSTWADTVETQILIAGVDNSVRLINDHVATEWTDYAGVRALHIRTLSNYTFNGVGIQAGREFTINGGGRRHIHRYIGEDGRYLGLVSADTSDGEARLPDFDLVVPIHQTRIDSLTIGN